MQDLTTIAIRLTPKASSNKVGQERTLPCGQKQLMVYVTAVAEDGKANQAMVRLLAKHFKVAQSSIQIAQGANNRNKVIKIV